MNEEITLGTIIREMAKRAIDSDDKEFVVPVKYIYQQLTGSVSLPGDDELRVGGNAHIKQLKSSYVSNTVSRMKEIKELDLRSKFSLRQEEFDGEPQYCAVLKLVPGAIKVGTRKANEIRKETEIIEAFKERVSKVMPDLSYLGDDEVLVAVSAIRAMKSIIQEMK